MENKARQARKLGELRDALVAEGYRTISAQASALGLGRSTTWTILRATHKASGLSASVISRILWCSELPASVRDKVLEYVEEKVAGLYGHSPKQIERFVTGLSIVVVGFVRASHHCKVSQLRDVP